MNQIIEELLFHMERAQTAYRAYLLEKKYFQALRIYKANKKIYKIITENVTLWKGMKEPIIQYIFHLEDWMEQFHALEAESPMLTDIFAFERLENSPSFPGDILDTLKRLI